MTPAPPVAAAPAPAVNGGMTTNTKIALFAVGSAVLGFWYANWRAKKAAGGLTPDQAVKETVDAFNKLLEQAVSAGDSAAGLRDKWLASQVNTPAK